VEGSTSQMMYFAQNVSRSETLILQMSTGLPLMIMIISVVSQKTMLADADVITRLKMCGIIIPIM